MNYLKILLLGMAIARIGATQEAPPPPVEPELAPESRLVDTRADELVRQMSELLEATPSFALEALELYDDVPEHQPRMQLANRRHIAVRRPDRMAGDASGDALNRSFWYDGQTLSVLDKQENAYAEMPVPPTIDGALDAVFDRTGMVVPLADFIYEDVYQRLMASVQRGVYLGIHRVGDTDCHHLAFEQETVDWQLWIEVGDTPLPRKLAIAYKTEDEVPQYSVTIEKWNLNADIPAELFEFDPPDGTARMDLPNVEVRP